MLSIYFAQQKGYNWSLLKKKEKKKKLNEMKKLWLPQFCNRQGHLQEDKINTLAYWVFSALFVHSLSLLPNRDTRKWPICLQWANV